jgi:hypothetical protein
MYRFYIKFDHSQDFLEVKEWLLENVGSEVSTDVLVQNMLADIPAHLWSYTYTNIYYDQEKPRCLIRFSHYQDFIHFKMRWS